MLKHEGGQKVGKGTYWNFNTGERVDVSAEAVLAGDGNTTYYKMPAIGVLVAGPFLGLLYAAFLPFIGIAMAVKIIMQKLGGGVLSMVRGSTSFGWRPSESYLAGKKKTGNVKREKETGGDGNKTD